MDSSFAIDPEILEEQPGNTLLLRWNVDTARVHQTGLGVLGHPPQIGQGHEIPRVRLCRIELQSRPCKQPEERIGDNDLFGSLNEPDAIHGLAGCHEDQASVARHDARTENSRSIGQRFELGGTGPRPGEEAPIGGPNGRAAGNFDD